MIIFFSVLAILFIIIFLLFYLSNFEIEINKLIIDTSNKYKKIENYLFYLRLKLFGKITWLKIKIDNKKIKNIRETKIFRNKIFNKLNIKEKLFKNKKEILKILGTKKNKELDFKIKKFNFHLDLCTSESIGTSFIVAVIASAISIILARNIEENDKNKVYYRITPIYECNPTIKLKLNCIITIKIVHIINAMNMLINSKRRVEVNERTSYRKSYVWSNDKY
jgi:hypothetical protein